MASLSERMRRPDEARAWRRLARREGSAIPRTDLRSFGIPRARPDRNSPTIESGQRISGRAQASQVANCGLRERRRTGPDEEEERLARPALGRLGAEEAGPFPCDQIGLC